MQKHHACSEVGATGAMKSKGRARSEVGATGAMKSMGRALVECLGNGDVRALFGLSWREAGVRLLPLLRKSSSSIPKSGSRG